MKKIILVILVMAIAAIAWASSWTGGIVTVDFRSRCHGITYSPDWTRIQFFCDYDGEIYANGAACQRVGPDGWVCENVPPSNSTIWEMR